MADLNHLCLVELELLDNLIYRSKNQHKSSLMLRKMIQIKRLLKSKKLMKNEILKASQDLYLAASSNLSMGFFIPLCLCLLGVSARIFYIFTKNYK
jgi:hypothetical protein